MLREKGFMAVLNPGDPVLLETPLYAGVLPSLRALGSEMIGQYLYHIVTNDAYHEPRGRRGRARTVGSQSRANPIGMVDRKAAAQGCLVRHTCLEAIPALMRNSSCPTGCNPSGCSASKERKLEVLKVCKKYDLLIFEGELSCNPSTPDAQPGSAGWPRLTNDPLVSDDPYCRRNEL